MLNCFLAKTWKQPKCPSTDEWIKKIWYIYMMEFYSAIKRMKWYHLSNMDGPRDYHIKWSKRQISYDITYMWNLKKKGYKWIYFQNRSRLIDIENKFMVTKVKKGGVAWGERKISRSLGLTYTYYYIKNRKTTGT